MNVIEELWYGKIRPFERSVKQCGEYAIVQEKIAELEHQLTALLPETDRNLVEEFCDRHSECESISEQDSFVRGFQLGVRLLLAAAGEYDSSFIQL